MARDVFAPEIMEDLDIRFTGILKIRKEKKDKKVNEIVQDYIEKMEAELSAVELAEYASSLKECPEKQWAFNLMTAKVLGGGR